MMFFSSQWKKVALFVLLLILAALVFFKVLPHILLNFLFWNSENRDWSIELPNGYAVWQINGMNAVIMDPQNHQLLEYVTAYKSVGNELFIISSPPSESSGDAYYCIDMCRNTMSPPYTKDQFDLLYGRSDIEWTYTHPRPPEAVYNK